MTTEPSETTEATERSEDTTESTHPKTVVVLDFGSQYSQLITRRVREAGVYSELVPFDASWSQVERSIRPASSSPADRPASMKKARPSFRPGFWDAELPVLGICYGMQLLAQDSAAR